MEQRIKKIIEKYASIYSEFEALQKKSILPGGDQKTGVIAEYYAKCYIENHLNLKANYAKPGDSHDVSYRNNDNKKIKIQVKCVSAHSKTRIIAPLSLKNEKGLKAFDFLYLIDLNENFIPIAFYINTYGSISKKADGKKKLSSSKMKELNNIKSKGSDYYDFKTNHVLDLLSAINM
jgi:hypothetical protein